MKARDILRTDFLMFLVRGIAETHGLHERRVYRPGDLRPHLRDLHLLFLRRITELIDERPELRFHRAHRQHDGNTGQTRIRSLGGQRVHRVQQCKLSRQPSRRAEGDSAHAAEHVAQVIPLERQRAGDLLRLRVRPDCGQPLPDGAVIDRIVQLPDFQLLVLFHGILLSCCLSLRQLRNSTSFLPASLIALFLPASLIVITVPRSGFLLILLLRKRQREDKFTANTLCGDHIDVLPMCPDDFPDD